MIHQVWLGLIAMLLQNPTLEAEMRDRAVPSWSQYAEYGARINGCSEKKAFMDDKLTAHTMVTVKGNGRCRLFIIENKLGSSSAEVHCYGTQYSFFIKRKSGKDPWVLISQEPRKAEDTPSIMQVQHDNTTHLLALMVHTARITDVLNHPGFQYTKLAERDPALLEIEFSVDLTKQKVPPLVPSKGTIAFLREKLYCIKSYSVLAVGSDAVSRVTASYTYDPSSTFPLLRDYERRIEVLEVVDPRLKAHADKLPRVMRQVVKSDVEIPSKLPPDFDFSLTAFGLPEPYGVDPPIRPTPWWLSAGIAVGVLFVLLFLLGLWKRRLLARS
jgi:hypothetical protein